jgi:hypothetical protein
MADIAVFLKGLPRSQWPRSTQSGHNRPFPAGIRIFDKGAAGNEKGTREPPRGVPLRIAAL